MQDSKNFSKNYEGLLPEEEAHLLELKRSVALDDAKPKIAKNFLSFVKYVWPEFIKGSHHKIIGEKFKDLVTALYDGSGSVYTETEVTYEDGRKGKISANLDIVDAQKSVQANIAAE